MKKRLAVIGGGAHTIPSYRAMLQLIAKEHDLTLFSEFHLEKKEQVDVYAIHSVSDKKMNGRWRTIVFFTLIVKVFFTKHPDIIHSHSTYPSGIVAIILGWLFRIPVVVCLDAAEASAVPEIKFGDLLHTRRRKLNKWVMNNAAAVTTLTKFQFQEVCVNLDFKKPIQIIPRGVDAMEYSFKEKQLNTRPIQFLSVAYLHPVKDHKTMLRAFKRISQQVEASLTLVGHDYENGRVHQLAKELGIEQKVFFAGFVSHEMMAKYYNESAIFLHTSLFESQAMAVVEAMASGVLVCGTRVGIMADLENECCLTVSPKDDEALANKVLGLINSNDEQARLRANAFKWVTSHSLQWTAQQYVNLYERLTK